MSILIVLAGVALIGVVLHDGFEVMLLPRRVSRSFRIARLYYVTAWRVWQRLANRLEEGKRRDVLLSWFGPSSVVLLFALWAICLIAAFGAIHYAIGSPMNTPGAQSAGLLDYFYFSGVTFFTLGFGDISPREPLGRILAVVEAGIGFAFLAVVISYLPVFYQAFSKREVTISLLDARAGSPPSAGSLLLRLAPGRNFDGARPLPPGVGAVRRRGPREPALVPLAELLPVAARQPVVAGRDDHDPRHLRPGDRGLEGGRPLPGPADLRDVQARGRRPLPRSSTPGRSSPRSTGSHTERLSRAARRIRNGRTRAPRATGHRAPSSASFGGCTSRSSTPCRSISSSNSPRSGSKGTPFDNWQTSAWMRTDPGIGKLALAEPGDDHDD